MSGLGTGDAPCFATTSYFPSSTTKMAHTTTSRLIAQRRIACAAPGRHVGRLTKSARLPRGAAGHNLQQAVPAAFDRAGYLPAHAPSLG